jgi:hypothetical protein
MINKNTLEKLKMLYSEKYGIKLSNQDAIKVSTKLINLMRFLLKPKTNDIL